VNFPWAFIQKAKPIPTTPREIMLQRLSEGVPPELAARAAGIDMATFEGDEEITKAIAEGEILLFERSRDSGVTGVVRAAQRHETKSWTPKAEATVGLTIEDLLKD
jgi:hypothetical protein